MSFKSLSMILATASILAACGAMDADVASASGKSRGSDDGVADRRGGSSDSSSDTTRGTAAWFVHESIEHATRLAIVSNAAVATTITGAAVTTTADTSAVTLTLAGGSQMQYSCWMFDDSSRSGTVIKKEVACRAL